MGQEKNERRKKVLNFLPKLLIPLIVLVIIAARIIWPGLLIDAITLGLLIVAFLPWFSTLIDSAKLPGGWELTFKKLQDVQIQQQSDIKTQQSDINTLKFLVSHFVTEEELLHLKKFAAPEPFPFIQDETTPFFIPELRRLRSLRLIAGFPNRGIRSLFERGGNIKDHFYITDTGREYLRLRLQAESETLRQED